ncbi:hypothetical protein TBLA_0A10490 [Henningerozyma blattae CBS 6284]|uniref:Signal recognition particle receptor subunit beta n=1 Tax=Henningerozyma blattae (strain ATCC 34711 / CBS 6284 / DSM 70876 / NBRC 10599 / NRRL Y-10934 / UCD 77-7) TaxID=1071380 RepID=I2GXH5_HENB6|nr:hypothetical protein TBLA_0A10490 [Tetrapisispora blattae CBS 6284]CCH58827.1 hypothetical protein TBLA_0A10490 [Tetrapisispora blattae CBS 6284]
MENKDNLQLPIIIALGTIIISTILISILVKSAKSRLNNKSLSNLSSANSKEKISSPTIILAGPSDSGKTSLFNKLSYDDSTILTVTSQEPNIANNFKLSNSNNSFTLIDYPGHIKLHYKLLNNLKNFKNLKGLIFLVDSTIDPKNLTDTAQFLYDILVITENTKYFNNGVDILLACNKSELFTSRPVKKILETLEFEIDKIIKRQKSSLGSASTVLASGIQRKGRSNEDDDENNDGTDSPLFNAVIGSQGFKFSALEGTFDVLDGSVQKNKTSKWEEWIDERF